MLLKLLVHRKNAAAVASRFEAALAAMKYVSEDAARAKAVTLNAIHTLNEELHEIEGVLGKAEALLK